MVFVSVVFVSVVSIATRYKKPPVVAAAVIVVGSEMAPVVACCVTTVVTTVVAIGMEVQMDSFGSKSRFVGLDESVSWKHLVSRMSHSKERLLVGKTFSVQVWGRVVAVVVPPTGRVETEVENYLVAFAVQPSPLAGPAQSKVVETWFSTCPMQFLWWSLKELRSPSEWEWSVLECRYLSLEW